MTSFSHIDVKPIAGALGAEIFGVDVGAELAPAVVAEIRQALLDHLVIFFRDQHLDDDRHKRFARYFGDIFVHPNFNTGEGDPEIVRVVRAPNDASIVGEEWHTDTTMMAEPPMGAILYAIDVPDYGADTLFANQYAAFEGLSPAMQGMLSKLRAVHNDQKVAGPQAGKNAERAGIKVREDDAWQVTENLHPVVATHPETGRKGLFVNASYTTRFEGMTREESAPLLDFLLDHGHRPEFTCRFNWRPGSIAFWDNRCTKHIAIHDRPDQSRHMQRIQLQGRAIQ